MPTLEHLPADASAEAIASLLDRDGALILDGVLGAAELARVKGEIDPYVEATAGGRDAFSGFATTRTGALVARSPACRDLVMHPAILSACDAFLKRACDRYQLHLTQVIRIRPGQGKQPLHRDRLAWGGWLKGVEPQLNTIWAMTDFTEENGATRVIPGSNHFDDRLRFKESDTEPAEMAKGSVLFYTGSIYHGGGANRSNAIRTGINITYNVSWLRQEENQYLSVPQEIARTLPVDLLRLMGYRLGAYALGYVDDTRDPIEVVRPDLARNGFRPALETPDSASLLKPQH
jgi:ectoine hydroxylase-related dioxygenase (phytanoyl-CoA dioxygenase family)